MQQLNIPSAAGAVDLSTLAAKAADASSSVVAGGEIVIEINQHNLREQIEISKNVVVVMVAVSQKHAASVNNAKAIVQAGRDLQGKVRIAVLDVDAQPAVLQAFGITTVPFTIAIVQGQPIPLADQELDLTQAKTVLEQILVAAERAGVTGKLSVDETGKATAAPLPEFEVQASQALQAGEFTIAADIYQQRLKEAPGDTMAQVGLYRAQWQQRLADLEVQAAVANLQNADSLTPEICLAGADALLGLGEISLAFEALLKIVRQGDPEAKEEARQRLIEFFEIVGACPEVTQARRALATALY